MRKYVFMNNLETTAPASNPYRMYIEWNDALSFREVCENKLRKARESKGDVGLPPTSDELTPEIRESLKKDLMFKLLLGNEKHKKRVVLPLIKAFFGDITEINDIVLISPRQQGEVKDSRDAEPDINWQETTTNALFILEMQNSRLPHYHNRLSLYFGKGLAAVALKGQERRF